MAPRTRTALAVLLAAVGLMAAGCGGDSGTITPTSGTTATPDTTGSADTTTTESVITVHFTPQRPLPEGFPVFPGAVLVGDDPASDGGYLYLYSSDVTAPEICEFFAWNLFEFGFTHISADCEDAFEFLVEAGRGDAPMVTVGSTDAAGAGAAYAVLIDHEVWGGE